METKNYVALKIVKSMAALHAGLAVLSSPTVARLYIAFRI
jgi:hypothetical protein